MKRPKRRHTTGFSYTGAGNKASVFNRKPRVVFSEIKDKLNTKSLNDYKLDFNSNSLSNEDQQKIKNNIRQEYKKKNIKIIVITIMLIIPLLWVIKWVVEGALSNIKF